MSRRTKPMGGDIDESDMELALTGDTSPVVESIVLGVYKIYSNVKTPEYKTHGSACFDIETYLGDELTEVTVFSSDNMKSTRQVQVIGGARCVIINPGERMMVPSGIKFDIPEQYKMSIYPRSGTALKQGLNLINCVGVVDYDYVDQTYMLVMNNSNIRQTIVHGERYAQAEIVPVTQAAFQILDEAPSQKTNRNGGFGSTQ